MEINRDNPSTVRGGRRRGDIYSKNKKLIGGDVQAHSFNMQELNILLDDGSLGGQILAQAHSTLVQILILEALGGAVVPNGHVIPKLGSVYDLGNPAVQFDGIYARTANLSALPTSATGLDSGDLWNDGGTVKIVT